MQKKMPEPRSLLDKLLLFSLTQKLVIFLLFFMLIGMGIMAAPFDWEIEWLPRDPVPVDAIPDIGENQQIVFTKWMGRSPQDIEDQITYPMTVSLLGIPGVKTIRSYSMFGFSTIYVIFKEKIDFYWSRSRILEKLNSLPTGSLPEGVRPTLGPDATALGQVFWYTLEGQDQDGNPTGNWDADELRSIQDWYVRYALLSAEGISEVASVGGYQREYQIDVDPEAMKIHGITLEQVFTAVRKSNTEVGARTMEINKVEYVVRGIGFIKSIKDIASAVIRIKDNIPLYVRDVSTISLGPAERRGALDKEGSEAVGGVAVVRYGDNPLAAIKHLKEKIKEVSPGLPKKTLEDGTISQVKIVPFYDRSILIRETLGTLESALTEEILVTIIVIVLMVLHLGSSILISMLLPLAVLLCFIAMKYTGIDANIVALSGIAIAIGTMVDMGIVMAESILRHLKEAPEDKSRLTIIFEATQEVGSAVLTAVTTTIISFLPVFTMQAAEGKLFRPLAFTKTYALLTSLIVALFLIPPIAHIFFGRNGKTTKPAQTLTWLTIPFSFFCLYSGFYTAGFSLFALASWQILRGHYPAFNSTSLNIVVSVLISLLVGVILAEHWLPIGAEQGLFLNSVFVIGLIGGTLLSVLFFVRIYPQLLNWCLHHRALFLTIPLIVTILGFTVWLGAAKTLGWLPTTVQKLPGFTYVFDKFPGLGKEFMPPLDEGSFLFMPTTMPHASIGEVLDVLSKQDRAIRSIPEVESAVGKLGRAETPLDPAPLSMIETVINYSPEFVVDTQGKIAAFRFDPTTTDLFRNVEGLPINAPDGKPYMVQGKFERDKNNKLIADSAGRPFRLWRPALITTLNKERKAWVGIQNQRHIWDEILRLAKIPGTTSAPYLQPISARIVMLQSGMRAPMGVKIKGPDLTTIEKFGMELEKILKEVPAVEASAVIADRIVGKPYLEIIPDREKCARYGITIDAINSLIEVTIGGKLVTTTVEGRERYGVRVRYPRELRNSFEDIKEILVTTANGGLIPLGQVAELEYRRGPQVIKSEDTFLLGYVLFDKKEGFAEVDTVLQAQKLIAQKISENRLQVPTGITWTFAGSYENQIRSEKRLRIVLPIALFMIFLVLYFNFKRVTTTLLVFSTIIVAWSGGFLMLWLYAQDWFFNFSLFTVNFRDLFMIHPVNLSVAVWVGFLALFGIASDDGVMITSYLDDVFAKRNPTNRQEIISAAMEAGGRRILPCMMTTATTVLALIPVLTSMGRGSDIMIPMAIPTFGGMVVAVITVFLVPVLYSILAEFRLEKTQ